MTRIGFLVGLCLSFVLVYTISFAEWKLEWEIPAYVEEEITDANGVVIGLSSNKPVGYRVYYGRPDSGNGLEFVKDLVGADIDTVPLRDLVLDGTNNWYFAVKAYNPAGESEFSNQVFLEDTTYPYKPPNPPKLRLVNQ